jgi:hypothetical protein
VKDPISKKPEITSIIIDKNENIIHKGKRAYRHLKFLVQNTQKAEMKEVAPSKMKKLKTV